MTCGLRSSCRLMKFLCIAAYECKLCAATTEAHAADHIESESARRLALVSRQHERRRSAAKSWSPARALVCSETKFRMLALCCPADQFVGTSGNARGQP